MNEAATELTAVPARALDPRGRITIEVHDTPDAIYTALARVFGDNDGENGHQWTTLRDGDVTLNFHRHTS